MKPEVEDTIEVESGTMSAEDMLSSLTAERSAREPQKPAPVGAVGDEETEDDVTEEPAKTVVDTKPIDAASEAGRVLADSRTAKRIERLRDETTLYADNLKRMGAAVPVLKPRTYGKPIEEVDHLSRYRHELADAFNKVLKAGAAPPRTQQPTTPQPAARPPVAEKPAPAAVPAPAKTFTYDSWEKYQETHPDADYTEYTDARSDARDVFKDEQRREAAKAQEQETAERTRVEQARQEEGELETEVDAYKATHPNFQARLDSITIDVDKPAYKAVQKLFRRTPKEAAPMLDYLADHPEDVTRLMDCRSLDDTILTFGEIRASARFAAKQAPEEGVAAEPKLRASRPSTNAPAPIARVPGHSTPSQTLAQIADEDDDADAYIAKLDPGIFKRAAGRPGR